ncbi:OLC1v1036588C1 [Oldenlandia corymbosa var. corymbosa]|uniref:OLC1v1036588C1 n=1 Tax=Oldenlandia corymbosa var. corymbosa TaxID=529605 RepID=A0AAV1CX03_OLDCO|nr:OLC1v1036588C1 [Oldenlandia corymbosa var. corymbosa]
MSGPGKRKIGLTITNSEQNRSIIGKRVQNTPSSNHSFSLRDEDLEINEEPHTNVQSSTKTLKRSVGLKHPLASTIASTAYEKQPALETIETILDEEYEQINDHVSNKMPSKGALAKRKNTRNISLAEKRDANITQVVQLDETAIRIIGPGSQHFITELGCVVGKMADFTLENFQSQHNNLKDAIIKNASEEALMNVPTGMDAHNWDEICNKFDSDSYKKLCTRNKANRAHLTITNANGTKSIARMIEEMAELIRVKDVIGMTPAAVCEQVLKGIPGQARGRSVPKKRVIALQKSRYEIEKEKKRADEAERSRDLLAEEVAASKEEYKKLEERQRLSDESVAAMQRKLDKLMEFMPSQNVSF